jgi:Zn-dependent M28 family amino/carboxypeptidase
MKMFISIICLLIGTEVFALGIPQVDRAFLAQKLSQLTGNEPVRVGPESVLISERRTRKTKDLALAFLKQEYERLGFTVSIHNYQTGKNLIAEKKGEEDRVVLVGAHYDAVRGVPGADDDGSGISASLALAQVLGSLSFRYTLRIVAFDEEESGLIGSTAYADTLAEENRLSEIEGIFIMDMVGYDMDEDAAFHVIHCKNGWDRPINGSDFLTSAIVNAISVNHINLNLIPTCTWAGSDHQSFWNAGLPAVIVTENFFGNEDHEAEANPCYHQSCDTIKLINMPYLANITQAVAEAASGLLIVR